MHHWSILAAQHVRGPDTAGHALPLDRRVSDCGMFHRVSSVRCLAECPPLRIGPLCSTGLRLIIPTGRSEPGRWCSSTSLLLRWWSIGLDRPASRSSEPVASPCRTEWPVASRIRRSSPTVGHCSTVKRRAQRPVTWCAQLSPPPGRRRRHRRPDTWFCWTSTNGRPADGDAARPRPSAH